MTEQVSVERVIDASPETLWAMVSDVTRMGEWSPETTACSWLGDATAPAVGARFKGRNEHGKKRWQTVLTVVEAVPGRVFVFEPAVGPFKVARWEYRFEPVDGGCRVTETWYDQRGWLVRTLGKPVSGVADRADHNRAGMAATLERLATAVEAAPA